MTYNKNRFNDYMTRMLEDKWKDVERTNNQLKKDPNNRCRICGSFIGLTRVDLYSPYRDLRICEICQKKVLGTMINGYIEVEIKEPYCHKCKSCLEACICDERKALNQLKK